MTYFTRKRFKKKCIQGYVNIPYGTLLNVDDTGLLYFNNKPVCYNRSQDAFDYFVSNHDNQGPYRAELISWILQHTNQKTAKHDDIWKMIWNTHKYDMLRRQDIKTNWIWYKNFYSASIELLEDLKRDIQCIEKGRSS